MLKTYKELKVWQKSYQLCLSVYKVTKKFPKDERYGIVSQMRRAVISIPSNIAEGYGRKTTQDYIRFLYIAYGSTCELETQLLLSGDLGYFEKESLSRFQSKIGEIERMLKALIKSLENKHSDPCSPRRSLAKTGILESLNPFSKFIWRRTDFIF